MSMDEVEPKHLMSVFVLFDEYGRVGTKYVIPLFDRFLLVLPGR